MSLLGRSGAKPNLEMNTASDPELPSGPADTVSQLRFSPVADHLAVPSWDKTVRIYEVNRQGQGMPRAMYEHQAPVLTADWWPDGSKVLSGGCDNAVRAHDLASGQTIQVGQHDQPVSQICTVDVGQPMIASASWDKTLRYWDLRQPSPVATVQLPERCYAMATAKKLLVVACADKKISLIDLAKPDVIHKTVASPLKHQIRSVACQSDGLVWAIGSVEGRCGIQYLQESAAQNRTNFSFRCQREQQAGTQKPVENVYSVNNICFHPTFDSVSTCGGDGTFHFWDKDNRTRLGLTHRLGQGALTASAFSRDGTLFAYAMGYDWSKGFQYNTPGSPKWIKIHPVLDSDVRPRPGIRKK